jgi:hypothetical protein
MRRNSSPAKPWRGMPVTFWSYGRLQSRTQRTRIEGAAERYADNAVVN